MSLSAVVAGLAPAQEQPGGSGSGGVAGTTTADSTLSSGFSESSCGSGSSALS